MPCGLGSLKRALIRKSIATSLHASSIRTVNIVASPLRPQLTPGSDDDDNDGDTANGLLQNILERVSNGDSGQHL